MAETTPIFNSSKAKFKMKSLPSTAVSNISRLGAIVLIAIAGLAATAANPALAHGDKAMKASPTVKEQKPWGIAGDLSGVKRNVTLTMDDKMRFTPDALSFKEGETVRFIVKNQGKLLHEMVIGTRAELDAHAALMEKFPNMAHDEPYMAHVDPGKQGGLVWTFNRPGDFEFACLVAGHFAAGMKGRIKVTAR
jgi:uncharacterized cupredoxin-like copper-binding protein